MTSFQKHHYAVWSSDRSKMGGLMKISVRENEAVSNCTRCGVTVKCGASTMYWVNGTWTRKRPPCEPKT